MLSPPSPALPRGGPPGLPSGRERIPAVLALLLVLAAGAWLARLVLESSWVMDADEAVHAIEALRRYDRLVDGRLLQFLVDVYLPERWQPPVQDHVRWYGIVHSLSLLPFFALLGPGDVAARLPSLAYLMGACVVFYLIARRLAPRAPEWSGLIAVVLLLSAPNVVTFTPQSLTETCVLFWCYLALLAYLRFVEHPESRARGALAGALIALALLSKYDHGLLLLACLGLAELVRERGRPRALLRPAPLLLFGVPAAAFALWLAHPDKLAAFRDTLAHPAYGTWRVIGLNFVSSWTLEYTSSVAVLLLLAVAFAACVPRLRDPRLRAVWLYAGLTTVLLVSRARFQFRYNIVEVPAFFLLLAALLPEWIAQLSARLQRAPARARSSGSALIAAGVALLGALWLVQRRMDLLGGWLESSLTRVMSLRHDAFGLTQTPADYAGSFVAAVERALQLMDVSLLATGAALVGLGTWLVVAPRQERAAAATGRSALIAALVIATVPGTVAFWGRAEDMIRWEWEGRPELLEVVDEVAQHAPARGRILLGGGWDQLTNNTLEWYLHTRGPAPRRAYDALDVVGDMIGSLVLPEEPRIQHWAEVLRSGTRDELPALVVLLTPRDDFVYREQVGPEVGLYGAILAQRSAYERVDRRTFAELGLEVELWRRLEAEVPPLAQPAGAAARGPLAPPGRQTRGRLTPGDKAWRHLAAPWPR